MNIRSLRFLITRAMDRSADVIGVVVHDAANEKLTLDVVTVDPYKPNPARGDERRYRITIEPIP